MNKQKQRYLAWGMMMGMMIGTSAATIMYAVTGEAYFWGLIGVGLALGLGLGAAYEKNHHGA